MAKKTTKTSAQEVAEPKVTKTAAKTTKSKTVSDAEAIKAVAETTELVKNETTQSVVNKKVSEAPATSDKKETIVRYSDEDLEMFAGVITEAKTEALDELRMLKERLEDLTSFDAGEESMIYSMHMAEQGSEAQEKEKTYAQIQRISEHIKKLEDAMERIRNKSYGICRVCGCLIAKERLLAVPVTTLSAAYKIHSKCPDDGVDKIEPVRI